MPTADFYDDLAAHYDLVFADWDASIERQSGTFATLLDAWGVGAGERVLDCSCGIGTQALGLAQRGFTVTASDVSGSSVARLRREAGDRRVEVEAVVADMRALPWRDEFAAVLSMDNAIAHLQDEVALEAALRSMLAAVRPGGAVALSVRDYLPLLRERPAGTVPNRFDRDGIPHLYVQSWTWHADEPFYESELFLLTGPEWTVTCARSTFRAWTLDEVVAVAERAGWREAAVVDPEDSGFYQPIVSGRRPAASAT